MWSEHCSYKSSRLHLLPTEAPGDLRPGENAGVIDIGDGQAAIFRWSRTTTLYIEPYQGAATGVGGILRDVFTMGAPGGQHERAAFGRPDHPKMKHLVRAWSRASAAMAIAWALPTVGGETNFHKAYDGNILVNAMTVGVADTDKSSPPPRALLTPSSMSARRPAAAASTAPPWPRPISDGRMKSAPPGQRPSPKSYDRGLPRADGHRRHRRHWNMGAAGLTSSRVEMASKGGAGIRLNMNNVPCRETGTSAL
jgi:phosphoribosylformylglycinamidine synthase